MSDREPDPEAVRRKRATIRRHQANPGRPSGERYWAESLERMPRDEIEAKRVRDLHRS